MSPSRIDLAHKLKSLFTLEMLRWWIVGIVFMGVNVAALYVLVDILRWPMVVSTLLAAEFGTILRFACNDLWVFRQKTLTFKRLFRYHIANAGSLAVWWISTNAIVLYGGHYLLATVIGMGCSVLLSIATNFFWIWSHKPTLQNPLPLSKS